MNNKEYAFEPLKPKSSNHELSQENQYNTPNNKIPFKIQNLIKNKHGF